MNFSIQGKPRKYALVIWRLLILFFLILTWYPEASKSLKMIWLILLAGILSGALILWWSSKAFRYTVFAGFILLAGFTLLPGRSAHGEKIATDACSFARMYAGRPYYWGGENFFGIDCSGLPRKSLILACLKNGIFTFNPALVRESIELWWCDQSARSLGAGGNGKTRLTGKYQNLNMVDYTMKKPGDIAVTDDGMHMLMYLGNQQWIQADPAAGKVIINDIPSTNAWFSRPVSLLRWKIMEE